LFKHFHLLSVDSIILFTKTGSCPTLIIVLFNSTQPGTYRASICKKLVDSTTTVAAEGSYSSHAGENQGLKFTVGLKHSVDPTLHFKARAGTSGASVALKKSYYAGKCAVKAAAHVDYNKWWRPKFGVVVSLFS
jgi:hypothetical protein